MTHKPLFQIIRPALVGLMLAGLLLSACTPEAIAGELPSSTPTTAPDLANTPAGLAAATATPTEAAVLFETAGSVTASETNCTYSPYYWQSHPDHWLTDNIVIGRLSYTKPDAITILASDQRDTASLILKEFFAVALNILKGADPIAVEVDMGGANDWLGAHPPGFEVSSQENLQGRDLAARLSAFNSGETGPGPCQDEPPTPTPTPTFTPTITLTPTITPIHPTETPTLSPTQRFRPGPAPTSAPPGTERPTDKPVEQPTQPPVKPPTPTSAPPPEEPTAAPPAVVIPTAAPPDSSPAPTP